ncbi:MAG: tyrosine-type recombinase/integrase [Nitrospiraceae bacterium]|nr:tyrosine-type recombinase/integrase [Nitrospiraceae bacterium]
MKHEKKKTIAPTAHRGGRVENIGPKKQLITWHQGRGGRNIRLKVNGTRESAEKILNKLREEFYAKVHKIRIDHDTTITDLADLVLDDYVSNNYKDLRGAKQHRKFWTELEPSRRADTIDADQLMAWSKEWRAGGLSPARVNRRMSFLLRGFQIACEREILPAKPRWTALKEAPPRSGTRSWDEFVAVRSALPAHAKIPVTIEFWLGTRAGETHALEWPQVRFHHRNETVEIRLKAIDTKTGEQRVAILGGDLYRVLADWHTFTRSAYPHAKTVCHYKGQPLRSIKTAWQTACVRVGLGVFLNPEGQEVGHRHYRGALIHDFRRTAVSNMEDAGISRKVAMSISGHRTDSIFRRYHIVKKSDLEKAGRLLLAHHEQEHGVASAPPPAPEKVFTKCSPIPQIPTNHPGSGRIRRTSKKR